MRIVVLGGGYAGVTLARKVEDALGERHELVLVDEDGSHVVQHELHRVVRAPGLAEEITIDLASVLERFDVVEARVESLDADERTVELDDGETLSYDVCAVCLGAEPALQVEGLREHATPLKRVEHARAIHERAVEVLESGTDGASDSAAEAGSDDVADTGSGDEADAGGDDEAASARRPSLVVGGAGLSGVQVAGELAALASERGVTVGEDCTITVLEQESAVAPGFGDAFQAAIRSALEERGVEVRTRARAAEVTATTVALDDGTTIEHDQLVWTGGIVGSSALGGERPAVDARLRLAERTFALGDAVRVVDRDGQAVPATAQAAVREAGTVAENVALVVEGSDDVFEPRLERFTFDSPGWVVSIGDGAVAQVGPTVVTGRAANALKTTVGVGYLGSVGALREAVDLVNGELGIRVDEE